MAKQKAETPKKDELAQIIYHALNKTEKVAYFIGEEDSPTDLDDWVSTASTMLDVAISNRSHGGVPFGRIVELIGKEGSGKSLVSAHILAETQKLGGIGVLIDTEAAVNEDFFNAVGVDFKKMVYIHTQSIEDIYDIIMNIIENVRSADKNKYVTIVVDSISNASTSKELESDFGKDGYATDKAIINSKAMRKITSILARQKILLIVTSQTRDKMNAMVFGQQWETSGGKAIRFAASARIFLSPMGMIKVNNKIVGSKVSAKVIKNRFGPPQRVADFEIYFDKGIDDYSSRLRAMKDFKIIKGGGGGWYECDYNGETYKFQSKDFENFLNEDKERAESLYQQLCEHYIMVYKKTDGEKEFDLDLEIVEE